MNLADINLAKAKPGSKTKTIKGTHQPVTSAAAHPSGGSNQRTTTTRSNDGVIECTSLDFYMTDRTHQTAACSSTEKQVLGHLLLELPCVKGAFLDDYHQNAAKFTKAETSPKHQPSGAKVTKR